MLKLADIFQSHMVLQREKPIHIFGEAAPGSSVFASLAIHSENDCADAGGEVRAEAQTACGADGKFCLDLPASGPGTDFCLTVRCGQETVTLCDILIGDVWMAMGQSNMEYFLRYDAHWQDTKMSVLHNGKDPLIRMYNTPQVAFEGKDDPSDGVGVWFMEGDAPWRSFSAPGYYFAKALKENGVDIPIGIVGCNWGGTPAQSWIKEDDLKEAPVNRLVENYRASFAGADPDRLREDSEKGWAHEHSYDHQIQWRAMMEGMDWDEQLKWMEEHAADPEYPLGPWHHYRPSGLYHTMVEKIAPFGIKGFLWYQGESNCGEDADIYQKTMEILVKGLREVWQDESAPFYFIQIAPFSRWLDCRADGYAVVRAQQEAAAHSIPNSAVTNIMDLGEHDDIHPKEKKEVGRRLAALALGHTYCVKGVSGEGPVLDKAQRIAQEGSGANDGGTGSAGVNSSGAGSAGNGKCSGGSVRVALTFKGCGEGLSAEAPFDSVIKVYTKETDSHAGSWDPMDCTACTQDYFTSLTGYDYHHPVPVRDAEAGGCTVCFTVDLDCPEKDFLVSFAQADWCEVTLRSSYNIPPFPFDVVVH